MIATHQSVYQFKIMLENVRPSVWRRIQVPAEYSMWDLSVAIVNAMGWSGGHLHGFRTLEQRGDRRGETLHIGIPIEGSGSTQERILRDKSMMRWFALPQKIKMKHEYDYGDGWKHMVVLEKIISAGAGIEYPRCSGGKRSCPPDNCGGPWGYMNLLRVQQDGPKNQDERDMLVGFAADWGRWDPNLFVLADVCFMQIKEREEYRQTFALIRN
jgi:hypothetical protein